MTVVFWLQCVANMYLVLCKPNKLRFLLVHALRDNNSVLNCWVTSDNVIVCVYVCVYT